MFEQYLNVIDEKADALSTLSDKLWDLAELSMQEYGSADEEEPRRHCRPDECHRAFGYH